MGWIERLASTFRNQGPERDSASQSQREALADLLVWAMYIDRLLTLSEREKIEQETRDLPWRSVLSLSDYLDGSITRARDALGDEEVAVRYLDDIYHRLADDGARRRAIRACRELVTVDGMLSQEEARLLKKVEKRFGVG